MGCLGVKALAHYSAAFELAGTRKWDNIGSKNVGHVLMRYLENG